MVVKSQATRSREQNRKIARNILAMKLEDIFKGNNSRAAKLREEATRKKASKTKKSKRKYIKLETDKSAVVGEKVGDSHGVDDDEGLSIEAESSAGLAGETIEAAEEVATDLGSRHAKAPATVHVGQS